MGEWQRGRRPKPANKRRSVGITFKLSPDELRSIQKGLDPSRSISEQIRDIALRNLGQPPASGES